MADESEETRIKEEEDGKGTVSGSSAARKKEPPAFAWKLTGYADGLTLTLLKCVERKDAEAQLVRLEKEGYYTGLLITALTDPVPPGPAVKKKWEPAPARVFVDDSRMRAARTRPAPPRTVEKAAPVASKPPAKRPKPVATKKAPAAQPATKTKPAVARKASSKAAPADKTAKTTAKTRKTAVKSAAKTPKTKEPKAIRKKK